ncbi:MAG: hypothetical protein JNK48_21330 [Bryobacterales bacterium]|nr:hypothetical protein [Bryobacterales bacterium]
MRNHVLAAAAAVALLSVNLYGQANCTSTFSLTTTSYTQDFNTLVSSGTALLTTLPQGWNVNYRLNGTTLEVIAPPSTKTTYRAGTGSDNAGDFYSFGAASNSDRAFGSLASGNSQVGNVAQYFCFTNNSGATVTSLRVAYRGEQYRNGGNTTAHKLEFGYSVNGGTSFTPLTALDFTGPVATATAGTVDGNATAVSLNHTITGLNVPAGTVIVLRWVDREDAGNDHGLAVDDLTVTLNPPSQPVLTINDVTVTEGNAGTTNMRFTVSLDVPAGPGGVTFDIATANNTALATEDYQALSLTGQTIPAGTSTYFFDVTMFGDVTVEENETFFVDVTNVTGAVVGDPRGQGTITNDDSQPVTCTPTARIGDVQGPGTLSPLAGQVVTVRAIVTANKFNGFFMQEEDADADANPLTSEGIFVFTGNANGPAAGTQVCVTGAVVEFPASFGTITEFAAGATVATLSTGNPLPAPITLTSVMPAPGGGLQQLEPYEGMRVTASSFTAASGTIESGGFNNATFFAVVTGVPRPFREPGIEAPLGVPSGSVKTIPPIPRFDANSELLRIDLRGQNQTAGVAVTAGQTVTNVIGVLDFSADGYELLQDASTAPVIGGGSTFTAVPAPASNQITVGHMSLENYTGTSAQQAKALRVMRDVLRYPDVVGVSEVSTLLALQNLAAAINAQQAGLNYTAFLGSGTGSQNVGFLVKTARIAVQGTPGQVLASAMYIDPFNGAPDLLHDRPPYVLKGRAQTSGGGNFDFTAIVVHLRSLIGVDSEAVSGATTEGNRVRTKRRLAAENFAAYLQAQQLANPSERFIVVGDYNAYEFNDGYVDVLGTLTGNPAPDPQVVQGSGDLVTPNFIDLVTTNKITASERFSYIFGGSKQVLDHVLVSQTMGLFVSALHYGRTNTEFPEAFRSDTSRPERVSDHDPVLAFINLPGGTVNDVTAVTRVTSTGVVLVSGGYNGFLRLTNLSGQTLTGPLHVLFDTLPAGITVANASGTLLGKPYLTTAGPLANGATVNIAVRYLNPGNVLIQPAFRVLQGSF